MPLMEIVTEADIHSPEEAYAFLTKLRTILRYLGVNSGDMEKGALRCEPNISVRTPEQKARGRIWHQSRGQESQQLPRRAHGRSPTKPTRQAEVLAEGGRSSR